MMEDAEEWVGLYVEEGNDVIWRKSEVKKMNVKEVLWNRIGYDVEEEMDGVGGRDMEVGCGRRMKVD